MDLDEDEIWLENYRKEAKEIAELISQAFEDAVYPSDENIVVIGSMDSDDILTAFKCKHWKEIDRNVLGAEYLGLPVFTSAGFRFYIPAYIIGGLLDETGDIETHFFAMFSLQPPLAEDEIGIRIFQDRVEGFTEKQKIALKSFVKFYLTWNDSPFTKATFERAIKYWNIEGKD